MRHGSAVAPISVLVVDDSLFMRTLVSDLLRVDPELRVIGTASSGLEAVRKVRELRPDCVVLDLLMPGQHGLMTLKIIMAACPTPVIILSAHCQQGAALIEHCITAGAAGVVAKPSGEVSLDIERVRGRLIREVKTAVWRDSWTRHAWERSQNLGSGIAQCPQKLVVIGASTGGQAAIESILRPLPSRLSVPLLVVQHAPSQLWTQSIAERWNRQCALPVKVAEDQEFLHPGVVYLAPGGASLTMGQNVAATLSIDNDERNTTLNTPQIYFCVQFNSSMTLSPSIDLAMQSAASTYGSNLTAIVLSGLGEDGVNGMRAVKAGRGKTIVQDCSAPVFQLPKAVIDAGLADNVLSPDAIATQIVEAAL